MGSSPTALIRLFWVPPQAEVLLSTLFPQPAATILVVDDDRFARRVAYRVLSEAGYRVLEAEDGVREALERRHSGGKAATARRKKRRDK